MAGVATMTLTAPAGTVVTLKYAEVLNKDGSVKMDWGCQMPTICPPGSGNGANQVTAQHKGVPFSACRCVSTVPIACFLCLSFADERCRITQTDQYTTKGGGEESYTPSFTYHGYRYVQVSGLPPGFKPTQDFLTGHFLHSNVSTVKRLPESGREPRAPTHTIAACSLFRYTGLSGRACALQAAGHVYPERNTERH